MCSLIAEASDAQLLPFRNAVHLAVALLAQVPEPLVVHLLVLGGGDEARGRLGLVDRAVAVDLRAARLLLAGLRPQRLRGSLGMIEAAAAADDRLGVVRSLELRMKHGRLRGLLRRAHALAPLRIWAIWMNLIGTPIRSAQPCWCIRQEVSAETMYSAPARAWSLTLS